MVGATIRFRFSNLDAEYRFVESYLPEAWERFESSPHWESGWFWSYGQFAVYEIGIEGGQVVLVFEGEPDSLVEAESEHWEGFDGLQSWECNRYDDPNAYQESYESLLAQQQDAKGDRGGELEYRYKPLTSRLALDYRREFDELLPAAPDRTEKNPAGVGFWGLIHALFVQCGYDSYEENEAYLQGIQSRLKSIALYLGAEAARAEYERLRTEFKEFESELEEWIEEQPTGNQTL